MAYHKRLSLKKDTAKTKKFEEIRNKKKREKASIKYEKEYRDELAKIEENKDENDDENKQED